MQTRKRWAAKVVAMLLALMAGAAWQLTPAYAADVLRCTGRLSKILNHPVYDGDTTMYLEVCVRSRSTSHGIERAAALSMVSFHTHAPLKPGEKLFDSFKAQIRLETHGSSYTSAWCNYTTPANTNGWSQLYTCKTATVVVNVGGGWTGDGQVQYNFHGDETGTWTWQLPDSPVIS